MEEVSLEEFLLKYDFRITNDKDIQLTRVMRICLDTVGENDWIYFGLYYDNVDKNTGINYFYYGYVNPTFYKAATLKSAVTSNYVLNLLKSKYPIMISMKEEIRNNMNDILNREER